MSSIQEQEEALEQARANLKRVKFAQYAKDGDLAGLTESIAQTPELLNAPLDEDGATAVLIAAQHGHARCVEYLIVVAKCDVRKGNKRGETLVYCTAKAEGGSADVLSRLEQLVAQQKLSSRSLELLLNQQDRDGLTPIHVAAQGRGVPKGKSSPVLQLLISLPQVDALAVDGAGKNLLFHAVEASSSETIRTVTQSARLQKDLDVLLRGVNYDKQTPLIAACVKGDKPCIDALLVATRLLPQHDAAVPKVIDLADEDGTALFHLCRSAEDDDCTTGFSDCLPALLEAGADINKRADRDSMTPLHAAASKGHKECVEILCKHGANTAAHFEGKTALQLARAAGSDVCTEAAEVIEEHCKEMAEEKVYALRVFSTAGTKAGVERCLANISNPGDLDERDDDDMSAVLLACKFGHAAIVDLLLRSGCDGTTFGGGLWRTGPVFTCQYGHVEVLRVLIEHGCFHDAGTQVHNEIPLHVACTHGHDDCIELILERRETFMPVAKSDEDNGDDEKDAGAAARGDLSNLHDSIPLLMRIGPKGSERAALQCYLQSKHDQVSTSIVLKMLENDLPCTAHGAFRDHGHSWWHLLERQSGLSETRCAELVKALLDCELRPLDENGNPAQAFSGRSIVRSLALAKDPLRRLCLQHTWPLVKRVVEKETYFCGRYDLSSGPPLHISDSAVVVRAIDHDPEIFYEEAFTANLPEGDDMLRTQEQFLSALRWLHDLGLYGGFALNETEGHNEGAEEHWKKAAGLLSTAQHRRRSSVGFNNGAKNTLPGVSRKAFLDYCLEHVGETARVAIKFMHYREQWLDEMRYRGLEPPASPSSPLPSSSSCPEELGRRFVVGLLPHGLSEDAIFSAVEGTSYTSGYEHVRDSKTKQLVRRDQKLPLGGSAGFPYAIIMPLAERSLAQIFREENPSPEYARQILIDLASALQHCHERGVMHGDIKMSNVVRVGRDIKLIDLDSALFFPIPGSDEASSSSRSEYAGLKFSSANLPPEMFYELASGEELEQFVEYWAVRGYPTSDQSSNERAPTRIEDKDKLSHWKKLRPTLTTDRGQERTFVVRTYSRLGPNGEEDADVSEGLPYSLLPAGPSLDLWALGMLAYHLLLGKALLASNVDEDLITTSRMQEHLRAATWSSSDGPNSIWRMLRSKPLDADAIRFLCALLSPDATERAKLSMKQVLDSAFLSRPSGAGPDRNQVEWLEEQLAHDDRCATLKSLLQCRVERLPKDAKLISLEGIACREEYLMRSKMAVEVPVPQCLVCTPFILEPAREGAASQEYIRDDYDPFMQLLKLSSECAFDAINAARAGRDHSEPLELLRSATEAFLDEHQDWYVYLLDEHTMLPMLPKDSAAVYPLRLRCSDSQENRRLVRTRLLPLTRVSLRAAIEALDPDDGPVASALCLGYPYPLAELGKEEIELLRLAAGFFNDGRAPTNPCDEFDMLSRGQLLRVESGSDAGSREEGSGGEEEDEEDETERSPLSTSVTCRELDAREDVSADLTRLFCDLDPRHTFCGLSSFRVATQKDLPHVIWLQRSSAELMRIPSSPKEIEVIRHVEVLKHVHVEVPVDRIVEKIVDRVVEVEKVVHVDRVVEKLVEPENPAPTHDPRAALLSTASHLKDLYAQMTDFATKQVEFEKTQLKALEAMEQNVAKQAESGCSGWCLGSPAVMADQRYNLEELKRMKFVVHANNPNEPDANVKSLYEQMNKFTEMQVSIDKSINDRLVLLQGALNKHAKRGGFGWFFGQKLPSRNPQQQSAPVPQLEVPRFEYTQQELLAEKNPMHEGGGGGSGRPSQSGGQAVAQNARKLSFKGNPLLSASASPTTRSSSSSSSSSSSAAQEPASDSAESKPKKEGQAEEKKPLAKKTARPSVAKKTTSTSSSSSSSEALPPPLPKTRPSESKTRSSDAAP